MIIGFELTDHRVGVIVTVVSFINIAVTLRAAKRATEVSWVRGEVRPAVAAFLTRHDTAQVELDEVLRRAARALSVMPSTIEGEAAGEALGQVGDRLVAEVRHAHVALELVAPGGVVERSAEMLHALELRALAVDRVAAQADVLLSTRHRSLFSERRPMLAEALAEARDDEEEVVARTSRARVELVAVVRRLVRAETPWWRPTRMMR